MRKPLIPILLGLVGFVLFVMLFSPKQPSAGDGLLPEGPAPEIGIRTPEGAVKTLADLRGKVVLVKFWATWCGPCAMSTPHMQALYEKRRRDGLEVLGVAMEHDDGRQIPGYVREMGVTYPVGMAEPPDSFKAWMKPNTGIPAIFIIDKKGNVRWSRSGYDPSGVQEIDETVDRLLRE